MVIEEFQSVTSFILHKIWQILEKCLFKVDLKHLVLNEVLNFICDVISDHDSILLSSKTSDADIAKHVLLAHKM